MFDPYSRNWIGNIPKRITNLLKRNDSIVVFLIDGLGYNLSKSVIEEVFGKNPERLYSTFPSSTAVAITSILTGLKPVEHKIVHTYSQRINNKIVKLLKFKDQEGNYYDLEKRINYKPFFKELIEKDIKVYTYCYETYLSLYPIYNMWFGKYVSKFTGIIDTIDGFVKLANNYKNNPGLHFFYTDLYDEYLHSVGLKNSEAVLHSLLTKIRELSEKLDAKIVIFGDHGLEKVEKLVEVNYPKFVGGVRDLGVEKEIEIPDSIVLLKDKELEKMLGGECEYAEQYYLTTKDTTIIGVKGYKVPQEKLTHGGLSENEILVSYLEY